MTLCDGNYKYGDNSCKLWNWKKTSLRKIFKSKNQKEELIISIPKNLLAPKSYSFILTLFTASNQFHQLIDEVCYFTVINTSSKFSSFVNLDLGAIQNKFRLYVQ